MPYLPQERSLIERVGPYGPAVVGKEAFEQVRALDATNPGGRYGPSVSPETAAAIDAQLHRAMQLPAAELVDFIEALDPATDRDLLLGIYEAEKAREELRPGAGRVTVYRALAEKGVPGAADRVRTLSK